MQKIYIKLHFNITIYYRNRIEQKVSNDVSNTGNKQMYSLHSI